MVRAAWVHLWCWCSIGGRRGSAEHTRGQPMSPARPAGSVARALTWASTQMTGCVVVRSVHVDP